MGRVLQSITQLIISNRWYVLDQPNYMFWPIEAIIRFVHMSYERYTYNVCNCVSVVRSQHLLPSYVAQYPAAGPNPHPRQRN